MLIVWGKFILLLILVYIFGTRATRSADIIAEKKKLARAFMGVVFISMITSFPELFTGISAAAIVKSPDIAIGQIVGSCIFNLVIIAVVELLFRQKNLYQLTGKLNVLPLGFSLIIIAVVTLSLSVQFRLNVFHVGVSSIFIFVLYLVFMYIVFRERKVKQKEEEKYKNKSLSKEIVSFIISAIIIIAVGIYLPVVGKELAQIMNWSDSFVGVIFLALVTSFPELVVSFSTVKMGAIDMLVGNIAGSNLFNIAIIFIIDVAYIKGDVLLSSSPVNISVGLIAILMNFVVFFAVVRQSSYRVFNLISINAILLIMLYLFNLLVIY
ncbi:MAG: sodium:calcium antiporter [Candidatus Aminicenantes bacterium]|nr:MAG: sodium:calcium antiporter [Candidatus Aminicenantes bacterium]